MNDDLSLLHTLKMQLSGHKADTITIDTRVYEQLLRMASKTANLRYLDRTSFDELPKDLYGIPTCYAVFPNPENRISAIAADISTTCTAGFYDEVNP